MYSSDYCNSRNYFLSKKDCFFKSFFTDAAEIVQYKLRKDYHAV